MKLTFKEILAGILFLILFVVAGYLSHVYSEEIQSLIEGKYVLGAFIYVFILIIANVVAPVNAFPLLPVAVSIWGVVGGALLSIVGWTAGAMIVYFLAQKYGRPFIAKFTNLETINRYQNILPEKNILLTLIGLRMIIPVDILSYALGLFVKMPYKIYFWGTLIGVTPFAFVFAYASALSIKVQIGVLIFAIVIMFFGLGKIFKNNVKEVDATSDKEK